MKRLLFFSFFNLLILTFSSAQTTVLTGRVYDSESAEALVHATVQVMKPDTTSMVTGGITNTNGAFSIKGVEAGSYVVKISYIGYHNFYRSITVAKPQNDGKKKGEAEMQFGTVMLLPSTVMLQSAVVTGTLKQVEVKEDTLIFNADAFKVAEGSVLEELIRKLPGAEVATDGTVKINGKTVNKILVDGKEFFGNDKSMAMKNLPTEIVDKVKTYDKQSEMSRMTGIDDGEEETVIDLSIKKGMKKGWFGNIDLGAGTKDRFAERVNVNRFMDGTQASVIGNVNNVNDRSMGGGRGGNGVTTRQTLGGNMALVRGQWEIGGNVRYSGSKSDTWTKSSSQNFVTTRTSFSNSMNQSISRNHSMNGDFRLEWKPDTMTTINFRPSFSFGGNDSHGTGMSATFNADPYESELNDGSLEKVSDPLKQIDDIANDIKVNFNNSGNRSEGENYSMNGNLILNRRLNTSGRNFSVNLRGSYSNNENRSYSLSDVRYFQFGDSVNLTYRYRTTPNWSGNYSVGFNYTEPLIAKKLFLQMAYRFNDSKRHSDGKAYDMGNVAHLIDSIRSTGAGFLPLNYYDYLDSDLSRYTDNENQLHNTDLQLRYVTQKVNMNVGVSAEQQHQKVDYQYQGLDTVASRNFWRISPTLNFRYRFNKQHTLRVRYRGTTAQPEITDMFNMTDNSNPLNIRMGNPDLKPSFTNNVTVNWNNYVTSTLRNYVANLNFRTVANSISNRTEYNEQTGGRITRPENINGNWNVNGDLGFTTPVFVDNFMVTLNTSASYQNQVGYIYQNQETLKNNVKQTILGERLSMNYRVNEDLLSYDIGLNGNLNYNHTRSMLVPTNNRDTYDFSYGLNGNVTMQNGLAFSTNVSMQSRRGYSASTMNTNELIWNAQASYRFLKNKQATVSLQAFDILANRSNISRTISATMRSDSENNAINSYVMAHFIYRLNVFGSGSARREMRNQRRESGGDFTRERDFQRE